MCNGGPLKARTHATSAAASSASSLASSTSSWNVTPDQPSRSSTPLDRHSSLGVFPNPEALGRLAGAVLVEAHDEWQVSDRRYLSEGSMALLTETTREVASAQLMPA